jgi:hypothetical protein
MRTATIIVGVTLLALLLVCSNSTGPEDEYSRAEFIEHAYDFQATQGVLFLQLTTQMDTTQALDSIFKLIQRDNAFVDSAWINSQGIAIEYQNGMRGGIMVRAEDVFNVSSDYVQKASSPGASLTNQEIKPGIKGTLLLCPIYSDRKTYVNAFIETAEEHLSQAGYSEFDKYLDSDCGLDHFGQLDGYGIIHIYSHSFAWPRKDDISEIYLMTGGIWTAGLGTDYVGAIEKGTLALFYVPGHNNSCFIAPDFLAAEIDLSYEKPLVYLGFGHSLTGGWQEMFVDSLNASVCVGFDWRVHFAYNLGWAEEMYEILADTSSEMHVTIGEWYNSIDTLYIDEDETVEPLPHVTRIMYAGPDDFCLWTGLWIESISASYGRVGDTIRILGYGFGEEQGSSAVMFGDYPGEVIEWSNTEIAVIVPENAGTGEITVVTDEGTSAGVLFQIIPIITSVNPTIGPGGTEVEIRGTNFYHTQEFYYALIGIYGMEVIEWTDTLVKAVIPSWSTSDSITISSGIFKSNNIYFMVPKIVSVIPVWGASGSRIDIYGIDFGEEQRPVRIGENAEAILLSWSDSLIVVEIPEEAETARLEILYNGNRLIGPYIEILRIDSIQPYSGLPGDTIQIFGDGFHDVQASNFVTIDGLDAEIIDWMDGYIVAIVPEAIDSGYVVVHVDGYQSNAVQFYYLTGDDIYLALHLTSFCRATFSGMITYEHRFGETYQTEFRNISIQNTAYYPSKWIVDSFDFGFDPDDGLYSYRGNFGKVFSDGSQVQNIRCVFNYALEISGGGYEEITVTHYSFKLDSIPLLSLHISDTIMVTFELTGTETQDHISEISIYKHCYEWDHYGSRDYRIWEYESTDWDNAEYPPSLTVTFSNYPIED